MTSTDLLLISSPGNVIDWAYAEAGIAFSYSVFLRDTGTVCDLATYINFYVTYYAFPLVWFPAPFHLHQARRGGKFHANSLPGTVSCQSASNFQAPRIGLAH